MIETDLAELIRLDRSKVGVPLWRNNVGAAVDKNGRVIRYGLANVSKAMNDQIKSSDLIGITPYIIKPQDVGKMVGVFTAYELKHSEWKYAGTPREIAQLNFINLVLSKGGIARFVTKVEDIYNEQKR